MDTPADRPRDADAAGDSRRAILVSFDALNEERVRSTLAPDAVLNFLAIFDSVACAEHATSAFPSLTAPSHASLWTGAYGDVTGVTANSQPQLPRDRHGLLDLGSGFSADALRAEPLWITAGRAGLRVVAHHVTQAPQPPAFHAIDGARNDSLEARLAEARRVLRQSNVHVLNGYNRQISPHRVLEPKTAPPRAARAWRNLDRLGDVGVPLLETGWEISEDSIANDSVFALFYGEAEYSAVLIATERDAANGIVAVPAPVEESSPRDRPLAPHFSEPLAVAVDGGTAFLRVRVFALSPDARSFLIYQPAMHLVEANRPEVAAAYGAAVRGWVGNAALGLYMDGAFGPVHWQGGDGTAEARYLETAEHITRQFMRGVDWAWNTVEAELMLDYFPLADAIDHALYGYIDDRWPGYDPETARRVQRVRERAWELVDLRLDHLRRLAATDPDAALFISGDHGMRATWQVFHPNAVLRDAGLLALTADGEIDLSRTRAISPNGYWISINRTAWQDGIVPPAEEARVTEAIKRALLEVRDSAGRAVVTRIYSAGDDHGIGLGGPTGGDVYYGTRPSVRWSRSPLGESLEEAEISGSHGFPSVDPDMWTVFCAEGIGGRGGHAGPVRTIDVAPTVAEWLGIPPPADARGRSVLSEVSASP